MLKTKSNHDNPFFSVDFDLKAFVEFKKEPTWGQRLDLDSTYLDFSFGDSSFNFVSNAENKDILVKYMRLIAKEREALDPLVEVLRPTILKAFNKFVFETMRSVFRNILLI